MEHLQRSSSSSSPLNLSDLFETVEDAEEAAARHIAAIEYACTFGYNMTEKNGKGNCPRTFDGWSCWNETKAGTTAFAPCPWFVAGFSPQLMAHKECLEDGTWFRHPHSNAVWSNYTTCVDMNAFTGHKTIVTIYQVGYSISLFALILSLIIFCSFRSLKCTRVHIHKHLFISFIINNTSWLVWFLLVVNEGRPVNELNPTACAFLHVFVQYFTVANYFWMFCEGFYLHTLIVYAFTRMEGTLLGFFYVFGWLAPAAPITFYAVFRGTDGDVNERAYCWMDESKWGYFISVPVCICLVLSFGFLINILRVLLLKLSANRRTLNRRESSVVENTAARATLLLIPLLGLNYLIIPFKPAPDTAWSMYYERVAAVSSAFQGLAVSLLFCFCNGEVIAAWKRRFPNVVKSVGGGGGGNPSWGGVRSRTGMVIRDRGTGAAGAECPAREPEDEVVL